MTDTIIRYIEKKPRTIIVVVLTFLATLSAVSGLSFYVLAQIVENERAFARQEVGLAKERYDDARKLLEAHAKLNDESITRALNSFAPALKEHLASIRALKAEFEIRAKTEDAAMGIYMKLSEMEYRTSELDRKLETERLIAGVTPVMAAVPPTLDHIYYILPRLAAWCGAGVLIFAALIAYVLKRKAG